MSTTTNKPKVGDKATLCVGSDRYPATVVSVNKTGRKVGIKRASVGWGNNPVITENPNALTSYFSLRKNGCWRCVGSSRGTILLIGEWSYYQDPSF